MEKTDLSARERTLVVFALREKATADRVRLTEIRTHPELPGRPMLIEMLAMQVEDQENLARRLEREPLEDFDRIELGIDGNAAFALLGEDIQSGECEFIDLVNDSLNCKLSTCKQALRKLRERLGKPEMSYFFGPSHPYGG